MSACRQLLRDTRVLVAGIVKLHKLSQ
jgi:hypothetical protein